MSLEDILARQEEELQAEEGLEDDLARELRELEAEFGEDLEELEEEKPNRQPGSGRGNSFQFTILKAIDSKGLEIDIEAYKTLEEVDLDSLTPKQRKARRKYERKKERKQLAVLGNEVEDF